MKTVVSLSYRHNFMGNLRPKVKGRWAENIFKLMAENIPKIIKIINPQLQEVKQTPRTRNRKKNTLRHNIIKLIKPGKKFKNLNRVGGMWNVTSKGTGVWMSDFL